MTMFQVRGAYLPWAALGGAARDGVPGERGLPALGRVGDGWGGVFG